MRPTDAQHRGALAGHADRTARYQRGELTADEWRPIRLSYGLYYQLDHTSHMQRIKIPGGLVTADQMDVLADIADRYGRGVSHVTTRQDIQIHWVPLDGIIDLYERLLGVGITTRGACADSVRNVTACPYAGVAPDEPFDVAPYCLAVHEYFLFNPLNLTLPRKFKIAVEGCQHDCAQAPVNDIGLYAKLRDGVPGFSVTAGGGLGAQPFLAKPLRDFIPAGDLLIWCEAIVRVQHRFGERKNRNKARMKYVVLKMGLDKFRTAVEAEVARVTAERGDELRAEVHEALAGYRLPVPASRAAATSTPALPGFEHWARTNARPQRQPGFRAVVVQVPLAISRPPRCGPSPGSSASTATARCGRPTTRTSSCRSSPTRRCPRCTRRSSGWSSTPPTRAASPTSCRAPAWTTARSRSRARWAWRSASGRTCWRTAPRPTASRSGSAPSR
jgi:sulfite reductase beta subunit-like hemoprotein